MLLTTDADLAGAVLHAKSSGLKVAHFLAFCDYLFQVQVAGLQITCSIHLTITNVHLQVLKLHIEDPSLNTEVTKPSQELALPPPQEWDIAASFWVNGCCSRSQWRSSDGLLETQRS